MSTADLLSQSRSAHQQAKKHLRDGGGLTTAAALLLKLALEKRLEARSSDPKREDPAWALDAQHPAVPGEPQRRNLRIPGLSLREVASKVDADLEVYYRQQLGEIPAGGQKVADPEVLTPKAWHEVKAGTLNPETGRTICATGHTMQLITFEQRICAACGRVEELVETKAREDTEAFKASQAERVKP